jgi:hypothetical protein
LWWRSQTEYAVYPGRSTRRSSCTGREYGRVKRTNQNLKGLTSVASKPRVGIKQPPEEPGVDRSGFAPERKGSSPVLLGDGRPGWPVPSSIALSAGSLRVPLRKSPWKSGSPCAGEIDFKVRISACGDGIPISRVIGIRTTRCFPHIRYAIVVRISARGSPCDCRVAAYLPLVGLLELKSRYSFDTD